MSGVANPGVVAVIDVGSNSVRLLVARELSPVAFEVIDEERFDARLAQEQTGGRLGPEGMERGLQALRVMAEVARSHAPSSLIAVGTEALRRAANADEFVGRVREETGLGVRILSPQEEAFASFLGVVNSTGMTAGYLLDIGGGSLELMRVEDRGLAASQSVPLGAIYAAERYLKGDPPTAREVRSLRKAVKQSLEIRADGLKLYGVGGAIRNLARASRLRAKYPLRRIHGYAIPRAEFHRLAASLARTNADGRRRVPGVNPWRADIIHAPAIVIDEVMRLAGASELLVAGQGLREGLVWQELRGESPVLPDVRAASIAGLARANGVDDRIAEPTVHAAAELFSATQARHGLGDGDRDLLLAAARLSTIGLHVDYYNRDRHAEYLLHSGNLHGFSHREVVLLAALVRWSHGGTPDLSAYRSILEADDAQKANTLAALLGAARAIRRRSPSPVHRVRAVLAGDCLEIELTGGDGLDAELYALAGQQRRLEQALRVRVRVSTG